MKVRHTVTVGLASLAIVAVAAAVVGARAVASDSLWADQTQAVTVVKQKPSTGEAAKDDKKVVVKERTGPVVVEVDDEGQGQKRVIVREGLGPFMAGGGPRLGIQIRDVAKDDVAKLKLAGQAGVVVEEVTKDSAAEKAGVKAGDVVVQFDGETVRSAAQLTRVVRETAPDRTVKMAVTREGRRIEMDVTPSSAGEAMTMFIDQDRIRADVEKEMQSVHEKMKDLHLERKIAPGAPMPHAAPMPGAPGGPMRWKMERPEGGTFQFFGEGEGPMAMAFGAARGRLGVSVQSLTPELAGYFGVKDGVLVSAVQADTPAAKAGLKAGDVITSVDDKAIGAPGELVDALRAKEGEVTLGVTRDKKAMSLKATIEKPKPAVAIGRTRA
jgi:serine protease Do